MSAGSVGASLLGRGDLRAFQLDGHVAALLAMTSSDHDLMYSQ